MTQSPTKLQKIEQTPQTLRDIVQERMREAIIAGHFAPGERLVERKLCDQLGVSRTVVRETIRFLEAEGLVETLPHRGPSVAQLTADQAAQIYEIRRHLEGAAAAACAMNLTPEFAPKLTQALRDVETSLVDTEWGDLLRATSRFYELIFLQAGHTIAWEVVQRLNGRISRLRALTLSAKDRETSGFSHMTAIHNAIISGAPAVSRRSVSKHINDAAEIAAQILETEGESTAE